MLLMLHVPLSALVKSAYYSTLRVYYEYIQPEVPPAASNG